MVVKFGGKWWKKKRENVNSFEWKSLKQFSIVVGFCMTESYRFCMECCDHLEYGICVVSFVTSTK